MSTIDEMNDLLNNEQRTVVLPLFPLNMVLFPGQVLPLHIFEPRYRQMINRCVDEKLPFGVVLVREDMSNWREYDGDVALPHEIGTTAHIRRVERLGDGRLNIVVMGVHRFQIRRLRFDRPYLEAEVEGFPLVTARGRSYERLDVLHRLLTGYMDLLAEVADADISMDMIPEDPRTLAFLTASILQVPWDDKQELLAEPELTTLLDVERVMLGREGMLLRYMQATEAFADEQVAGPTGYIYPN